MIQFFLPLHLQKVALEEMAHLKLVVQAVAVGKIFQMEVEQLTKDTLAVQVQYKLAVVEAVRVLLAKILHPLVVVVLVVLA
jgi:hypothetical protein